ncbi:MAG: helix-turn-helix domain-containing protein [Methylococcales bacterium]|nr:helix-turn-helix domain containing protein [Methylococcaceae bacterium]
MKFITKLTSEEKETLLEAYLNHPLARVRQRAHAVLLNDRKYLISEIHKLFEVRHQTVSAWLKAWEAYGFMGLYDNPRSGRPTILTEDDKHNLLSYWEENSQKTKLAVARLQAETGKEASMHTFRRILRKMAKNELSNSV